MFYTIKHNYYLERKKMKVNTIQSSQHNFSSLKIKVKDNGDTERKKQLEAIRNELPKIQQMPEIDKYEISITGKGRPGACSIWEGPKPHLEITAKKPGLFKTKKGYAAWYTYNKTNGSIQDAIRKALLDLFEQESRKNNGINIKY